MTGDVVPSFRARQNRGSGSVGEGNRPRKRGVRLPPCCQRAGSVAATCGLTHGAQRHPVENGAPVRRGATYPNATAFGRRVQIGSLGGEATGPVTASLHAYRPD